MNRNVFSIALVALIGRLSVAEIVIKTSESKYVTDLYDAAIDIMMTCHGDPGDTVAIVGDPDGLALKALRSNHLVPVILLNDKANKEVEFARQHPIRSFVIVAPPRSEIAGCMTMITNSIWWNQFGNFIFINPDFDDPRECLISGLYMYIQTAHGLLNAQYICYHRRSDLILLFNSNQFARQAPPEWRYYTTATLPGLGRPLSMFVRMYLKGGQSCKGLNFPKTLDIAGWPIRFIGRNKIDLVDVDDPRVQKKLKRMTDNRRAAFEADQRQKRWFVDNVLRTLNATGTIVVGSTVGEFYEGSRIPEMRMTLWPTYLSAFTNYTSGMTICLVLPLSEIPMFAISQHTPHKSQLEKIVTVIDGKSRIGVCAVYLVTLLFFKLFLRQALMPALLNLMRLTCNTGLPNLPNGLAPSVYLACLLMFVVTLQGIYTGNLATLLTTTIAHRNVQTKMDIASLGYTVYTAKDVNAKLAADPDLEGRVIGIGLKDSCMDYVMREPLATCVLEESLCITFALRNNIHISRYPIVHEYIYFITSNANPLTPRLDTVMKRWVEHGLWYTDPGYQKLRVMFVDDDEVKKNMERRVMNMSDLGFAFVILGVGLLCAFGCFVGEIVVFKVRMKMAQRRKRLRPRLAWGVKKNSFLSLRSLNFRFNPRRLFSRRR